MRIVELIIDEKEDLSGVEAISVVEFPAIEENFIALNQQLQLAKVDEEKRILMGAALIPNKNIYRRNGEDEYYIFFSDATVKKASELFLMNSNQNNATLEHQKKINDLSVVEFPAIEENFIALNKQLQLAKVDDEKRILMGAALIPNKNIYRRNGDDEYYIFFSDSTVKKASELFLMNSNQNNATLEHQKKINDLSVVESWIVEDTEMDKSKKYGLNAPVGTWMVSMKVNNDTIWNDFVKTGKVKGFSIEGYFADKLEMSLQLEKEQELIQKIKDIILKDQKKKVDLESYTDYPKQATENAKIALRYAEENGWGSCGTAVGKARANQLANREPISEDTIARMASFERQRQNSDKELGDGCGRLMWLAWGGDAGVEWAQRKLKSIRSK
jgi:hypothetical protein